MRKILTITTLFIILVFIAGCDSTKPAESIEYTADNLCEGEDYCDTVNEIITAFNSYIDMVEEKHDEWGVLHHEHISSRWLNEFCETTVSKYSDCDHKIDSDKPFTDLPPHLRLSTSGSYKQGYFQICRAKTISFKIYDVTDNKNGTIDFTIELLGSYVFENYKY